MEVEELNDQVIDKENEMKKLVSKLEECRRKIAELTSYKEKAIEYDSIIDKYQHYEKENSSQHEKIKKYSQIRFKI